MCINEAIEKVACGPNGHEFAGGDSCIYCGLKVNEYHLAEEVVEMAALSGEGIYTGF